MRSVSLETPMHHGVRIILSLALAAVVCAQRRLPDDRRPSTDQLARDSDAAEWTERRFLNLARQFVEAWNDFVLDYDSCVCDARKAAKLAKAFHKLERAVGWVRAEEDSRAAHSPPPADAQ